MGSEDSILSKFIVHYAYILHMEMACMHEGEKKIMLICKWPENHFGSLQIIRIINHDFN